MRRLATLVALVLASSTLGPASGWAQGPVEEVYDDAPQAHDAYLEGDQPDDGAYEGQLDDDPWLPGDSWDEGPGPDSYGAGSAQYGPAAAPWGAPREGRGIIDFLFRRHRHYDEPCDDCPPWWRHRTRLWGELLYLRPRDAEVAYAVPINGPVAPVLGNGIQIGPAAVVDPDYTSGFRVGFVYALDSRTSLAGTFWSFRSNTEDDAAINAPDVIRSLVTHPLGANAATDVLATSARLDVDFDIADADYRARLVCTDCYSINYVFGARYASLTQDFHAEFSRNGVTTVDTSIDFDGGGIRLGLDGERAFRRCGWVLYGRGTASFVAGEFRARYQQFDAFQQSVVDTDWRSGRIVPILDVELGVGWIGPNDRFKFSAGYLVSAWFNAVKTDDFIKSVQTNDFRDSGDTLTFDGLTARVEYTF
jgi:hypothetical protein